MKIFSTIILLMSWILLFAQQEVSDSTKKPVTLNEVLVVDQSAKSAELGFYQTTRQNGIENVMERMAGVSMIRRGSYAPDIVIHGMRNSQVGITIDGMQIFGACTDRMDPTTSYVETNNLESVSKSGCEEDKGCHSANIAGGVDLKLKQSNFSKGWHGMLGGGYLSNGDGLNGLFNMSYSNKRFATNINAIYRRQRNYTDGNGQEVLYSQFEKMNFAANLRYRLTDNQVVQFDFILDDAYNVGYAALPMDVAFAKARIYGLTYNYYLSGFFKEVSAKVYYNFIDHAMDDSQRPDVPIRMDMPGISETWGGFLEGSSRQIGKHSFYAKTEVFSNFRHAEMTMYPPNTTEPPMYMVTWPDVRKTSALGFVKDKIQLNPKNAIVTAARLQADFNDIVTEEGMRFMKPFGYTGASTFLLPSADATFIHQFNNWHSASLLAGYSTRGPSTSEQYAFYLFNAYDGYDYIGKPDILQEDAFKAQVGYQLNVRKWRLELNAYGYHINNYILGITDTNYDAMTIGANGVRVYSNIAYANLYGVDMAISGDFSSWLSLLANVSYTRGIMHGNQNVPLIPPVNGIVSLKGKYKGWELLLETEFASKQDRTNKDYGDFSETPGYFANNVRLLKAINFDNTTLNVEVGVDNIWDTAYRNHLDWGGILRPGRNFYLQLKYGF